MAQTTFPVSNVRQAKSSIAAGLSPIALTNLSPDGAGVDPATRRRWSRRMLVAVAACVLGLLPGIPGLASAGPAGAQAARPDQPPAASPAGGLVGAGPPSSSGPKDYAPNLIVHSTGAPDEQLNVAAALDQGTRLFLLQARYRDAGGGQADYFLAGPQGVSRQPLRSLFAPLGSWLAAPGHEHAMVMLGLRTDSRSANPAGFDAACQALISTLGPYLLKASDLPADKKSLEELTRDEQAALRSRPRVVTDWSACTGEEPPIRRPQARSAAAVPLQDHWMADQKDIIGQRPLRQVVIPGSHDAATYDDSSCPYGLGYGGHQCWPGGPIEAIFTQAQSQDITAQLNAGSRYLDLRFSYADQEGYGGKNFYNFHGTDKSGNPNLSYLQMGVVLYAIDTWINQPGHEREIVWLGMQVYREDQGQSQSKTICEQNLGWELAQGKVFQSSMLPPNTALTDMSMNEIWALPGHPQIIVTGWSSCTGADLMASGGAYAGQCSGEDVWNVIFPELQARTDWMTKNLVTGAYNLGIQSTPEGPFSDCDTSIWYLAPQQGWVLSELETSLRVDGLARANLNVFSGDYLGDPGGEGVGNWPIVQSGLTLNQQSAPVALSWMPEGGPPSVTVSCKPASPTGPRPNTMVIWPVVQGPQSPNLKTFTPDQSGSVQGTVSSSDFPGAGAAPDGSYLVAACAWGGSPLDPPGSSGAEISRIVIPHSPFVPWPVFTAAPINPDELPFTCSFAPPQGASANAPATDPVTVFAYPAGNQLSPDAQTFVAPAGQLTLQATYKRRGSYDVGLDCSWGNFTSYLSVPNSAFFPALTIRADQKDSWQCDRRTQGVQTPFTLSLAALIPNPPTPLSVTGFPKDLNVVLTVTPDYFPPGDYLLTATCVSNVSSGEQWTATPLTLSSSQIPTRKVDAEITSCSKQSSGAYTCTLQVTLGAPLARDTVFSVFIESEGTGSGGFDPSRVDPPQVTVIQGCRVPPLPSPYLKDGNGNYTRYDVNISTGGCDALAVVTFNEAIAGVGVGPIVQQVTVPGLGTSITNIVWLPQQAATRTGMAVP